MASKELTIKYKNCKFDFKTNTVVEYAKDDVFVHKLEDVFQECGIDQNECLFEITLKEASVIAPKDDEVDGEEV